MSFNRTIRIVVLGISICFCRSTAAQEFHYTDLLATDSGRDFNTNDYNPVTLRDTTVSDVATRHSHGPYMLASATQNAPETVGAAAVQESDSCCETPCQTCCLPCWTFLAEAIWLDRDNCHSFGTSFPGSNEPSILNTNQLNFNMVPGYRLTLARSCSCDTAWEVSYFAIQSWNETAQVVDPNRQIDSFLRVGIPDIANFRNAFAQTISIGTDLYSFEVNKRRLIGANCPCTASVLAGFRYIHLSDHLQFLSNDVDPAIDPTDIGLYTVRTTNDLVGGQVGGSLIRRVCDSFSVGCKLKAGLFANFAQQNSHLLNQQPNVPPSTDLFSQRSQTQLSSVIETGVFSTWQLTCNCGVRAGYDVFIISGLALTPGQLDFTANTFTTQPFVNTCDTLVAHGPSVGVWCSW